MKARPSSIVMITFTNKAASEMKARINKLLSAKTTLGYVGTFHSFCARILRIDGEFINLKKEFVIYDESDQLSLIKSILKKFELKKFTPSYFVYRISSAKNELISPGKYLQIFSDYAAGDVARVYSEYQKELKKNNACDFDDLILKTIELLDTNPKVLDKYREKYRYLLVDEFQDTNHAQYFLLKLLGEKYKNVTVVGDFSQSIYAWRGANIKNLEKFQQDFADTRVFYLEKNYRSTQNILDFAYQIISKNKTHPILQLHTENDRGEEIDFRELDNEEEEARFIVSEIERLNDKYPYSSFTILYRTNAQSRVLEETLLHYGIPYVLVGGTRFYERREIKDILSYLRLLINPEDGVARGRIEKLGKRRFADFKEFCSQTSKNIENMITAEIMEKVFQATGYLKLFNPDDPEDYGRLENIKELKSVAYSFPNLIDFLENVALVESEYSEGEKRNKKHDGVKMMTLHACKGLEWDCVFIVGVEEGLLPHSRSTDDHYQIEEERRLFYVGITRARNRLYITNTRRRFIFGRRSESIRSRFLLDEDWDLGYNRI